jgi:hypothetical protein
MVQSQVMGDGSLLFSPSDALVLRRLAVTAVRAGRGDGLRAPASVQRVVGLIEDGAALAVASGCGTSEVPREPTSALLLVQDLIDVATAAEILGCSQRYVRELCTGSLESARRVGSRWLIDRAEILGRTTERAG